VDSLNNSTNSVEVPLKIHRLRKRLKKEEGLSWSDYLILCAIKKIMDQEYFVTTKEVHEELEMDRVWIYQRIRCLANGGFLVIDPSAKVWIPNQLGLTIKGEIILGRAGRELEKVESTNV